MAILSGGWSWFPIAKFLFSTVGLIICYWISKAYDHVSSVPNWPFVSDMGDRAPERCVFVLCFNWYAAGLLFMSVGFYNIVETRGFKSRLNKAVLVFGIIVSVGISLAGSFEYTEVLPVHIAGAFMGFTGGIAHSWLIIAISWKYFRQSYPKSLIFCRTFIASVQTAIYVLFTVYLSLQRITKRPDHLLIAAVAEWALLISQTFFYATIAYDFKSVKSFGFMVELTSDVGANHVTDDAATQTNNSKAQSPAPPREQETAVVKRNTHHLQKGMPTCPQMYENAIFADGTTEAI